jgi:hypothetical protein
MVLAILAIPADLCAVILIKLNHVNSKRKNLKKQTVTGRSGHRVISLTAPWMTAGDSFNRKPEAFKYTVLPECIQ